MAARYPDREAVVIDQPPGPAVRVTYATLDAAANRLAHALRAAGLRRGDALAVVIGNADGTAAFDAFWAAMRLGLYFIPVNRYLRAGETRHILTDAPVRAVVAGSAALAETAAADEGLPLRARLLAGPPTGPEERETSGFVPLAQFTAGAPDTLPDDPWEGQVLLYSSGTSGRPKGILRDLPAFRPGEGPTLGTELAAGFDLRDGDRYLCPGPLHHSAPIAFSTAQQRIGGTVVVMGRFDAERALDLLETEAITTSQWVPTMFSRLLALPEAVRTKARGTSASGDTPGPGQAHRVAFHAAAPCPVDVKRRMIDWWGPILVEYYSGTEGGRTMITSPEWLEHPGSVGRHWRGWQIHVLGDDGRPCPPGVDGRIYFEAPDQFRFTYLNQPEATAAAYISGDTPGPPGSRDRFTLGDVGHLDADGYLYVTDRATDMVISGGVNIYPREVENALLEHPDVADVAVIGIPDDDLGERVIAVVEPAPGASPEAGELIEFCRARIAHFKCPRAVEFVDALPRSEAGKLQKPVLRERYGA